ncbi:hypothetical protein N0V93_003065 [Gnomoniopsis smithogilvyi]|uniref:Uncharacterized protein n=1 Tax=Gnomoniopsis smithogilvyi TaxID=1191159 RepID=A0A9W9CY90_9PEZI|nr:hypothetical protein N0V93_003065 [Gnomoniopsis smithogilvyi]
MKPSLIHFFFLGAVVAVPISDLPGRQALSPGSVEPVEPVTVTPNLYLDKVITKAVMTIESLTLAKVVEVTATAMGNLALATAGTVVGRENLILVRVVMVDMVAGKESLTLAMVGTVEGKGMEPTKFSMTKLCLRLRLSDSKLPDTFEGGWYG